MPAWHKKEREIGADAIVIVKISDKAVTDWIMTNSSTVRGVLPADPTRLSPGSRTGDQIHLAASALIFLYCRRTITPR